MLQLALYHLHFLFFVCLVCTHCTQDPLLPHKSSTDKTRTPKQYTIIAVGHHTGALTNTVCLNIITNYKSYIIAYTCSQQHNATKVIKRSKDSNIIIKINKTITQHVTKVFTVKQITNTERKTKDDDGQVVHEELRGMQQMNEWESHAHRWEKWGYKAESHGAGRHYKFKVHSLSVFRLQLTHISNFFHCLTN